MTAAVLDSPGLAFEDAAPSAGGRGVTLEERLSEALRAARADAGASCPICYGQMTAGHGGGARCDSCGSRLT